MSQLILHHILFSFFDSALTEALNYELNQGLRRSDQMSSTLHPLQFVRIYPQETGPAGLNWICLLTGVPTVRSAWSL